MRPKIERNLYIDDTTLTWTSNQNFYLTDEELRAMEVRKAYRCKAKKMWNTMNADKKKRKANV